MIREPQGVAELMARTEADWQRQLDDCADATAEARSALVADLVALRAEYGDADYPRKAAIEKELRTLMRRHDALGAETEPEDAAPAEPPPPPPPPPPMPEPEAEAPRHPHGPVPLGPESSVRPRGVEPPHEAVPLGPESAVRSADGHRPAPPPPRRAPGGAERPIPHGAPGPRTGFADREGEGPSDAGSREDDGGWSDSPGGRGGWGGVGRWFARGRLAVRIELLLRKREARLSEVGVRIRQLEAQGMAGTAGTDAGVRARLAQVAQVEAEIARVKARRDALGGS